MTGQSYVTYGDGTRGIERRKVERRTLRSEYADVWKWIATFLAGMVVSGGGFFLAHNDGLSPDQTPWARDSAAVMQRLRLLERSSEITQQRLETLFQGQGQINARLDVMLERLNTLINRRP